MSKNKSQLIHEINGLMSLLMTEVDGTDSRAQEIANVFCSMSDDGMAQFFVYVAKNMGQWENNNAEMQLCYLARHLKTCECSDPLAIKWIDSLHTFLKLEETK